MPSGRRFRHVINHFRTKRWWFVRSILGRRGLYQDMLKRHLRKARMPQELMLLAGIESNYRPLEYSWAHAAGMWQFIRKTGLRFGLKITAWRDERYNIPKATRAAAGYLRVLQKEFRQWEWSIAAYNCGEKCVRRVRRRCPGMSFWKARLRRCSIPKETRQYVARFFAVLYFYRNPSKRRSGITLKPPMSLRPKAVRGVVSLPTIAEGLGVTMKQLREWNPELISWATPPGERYTLMIPAPLYPKIRQVLRLPSRDYRLKMMTVDSPGALAKLARRYNLSVPFVKAINHAPGQQVARVQRLLVPLPRGSRRWNGHNSHKLAAFGKQLMPWSKALRRFRRKMLKLRPVRRKKVCVRIEAGDSYWHIGHRTGIAYRDLLQFNGRKRLHPGSWLRLAPGVRCPVVQKFVKAPWSTRKARRQWKRGWRLLHVYPQLDARGRLRITQRRRFKRKVSRVRRRRRVRRVRRVRVRRKLRMSRRGCHRVRAGETVWGIARRYQLTSARLLRLNPRSRKLLRAGVWLRLQRKRRCPR